MLLNLVSIHEEISHKKKNKKDKFTVSNPGYSNLDLFFVVFFLVIYVFESFFIIIGRKSRFYYAQFI